MSVYKKKGYNIKRIRKNCTDTLVDPVLGLTYNVGIKHTYELKDESHHREQTNNVGERSNQSSIAPRLPAANTSKSSPDEK